MHKTGAGPNWTWAVTVLLMVVIAWLSSVPGGETWEEAEARALTPQETRFAAAAGFETAQEIVIGNCSMCHAREPVWEGFRWAPKGVHLETTADIARHARDIYLQAGASHAMPPPNVIALAPEDRAALVAWYRAGRDG